MATLSTRPDLSQLKKQAKELLRAHQSGNAEACRTLKCLSRFETLSDTDILQAEVKLQDVQFALAMTYGFESWAKLKKEVLQRNLAIKGNSSELAELLKRHIHSRSRGFKMRESVRPNR